MTGIVREIGRSFLVSCFLPAVVFISLSKQLFFPVLFGNCQPLGFLVHSGFEQAIALVAVASAFIGYLLWSLNPQLVRLFEGYYCRGLLRPWEKRHKRRQMQMLEEVNAVRKQYGTVCDDEDMRWESECQYTAKEIELETFYSLENDDVMPTAIGNVFRAFEQYPGRRYGIDAVLFWPRLTSVISPEVARVVEETNNTLTFLLTSCLMCSLLGVESLAVMLIKMVPRSAVRCVIDGSFLRIPIARPSEYCFYGLFAICVFILAFGLKHGALKASIAFGELVKSCFDLFHQDLLKKMAGETALQDEWRAWTRLQRSILVDRNAWLPEWEEDEEQEKVQNADKPASRSCLDHVFISGLTAAFLVKEIFCGDISAPACSDSRTDHTALAERSL